MLYEYPHSQEVLNMLVKKYFDDTEDYSLTKEGLKKRLPHLENKHIHYALQELYEKNEVVQMVTYFAITAKIVDKYKKEYNITNN